MARIIAGRVSTKPGDAVTGTSTATAGDIDDMVFLGSVTATNSSVVSTLSFASVATDYSCIKAFVTGLKTATISVVGLRTSSDGSNFAATDGGYKKSGLLITSTSTGFVPHTTTSTTLVRITGAATTNMLATIAGAALDAEITLFNLNATATNDSPQIQIDGQWHGSAELAASWSYARRSEAIAVHAIQLVNLGGGNFEDGRLDWYGIKRG